MDDPVWGTLATPKTHSPIQDVWGHIAAGAPEYSDPVPSTSGGDSVWGTLAVPKGKQAAQTITPTHPENMTEKQRAFIQRFAPAAQEIEDKYGVPASVALAQAGLESGWDADARTLFGIKGRGDAGSNNMATTENYGGKYVHINDNFAAYSSPEAAFDAYGRLISQNPRYSGAMEAARRGDIQGTVQGIKSGGYATDPYYVGKIMNIINTYGL